ncbi:MAG: hypothetical protein FWF26_05855, partial [Treponema sp.]|nr:hypothetical protein [Treponema sp.]
NYGEYEPVLTLQLEKGNYAVTFIEPETMKTLGKTNITSGGGQVKIACPRYTLDLAVKIIAA